MDRNREIKKLRSVGATYKEIAFNFKISRQRAHQIVNKKYKFIMPKSLLFFKTKNSKLNKFITYMIQRKKFKVYKNGYPDYMVFTGKKWYGLEAKREKEPILKSQKKMMKVFSQIGIPYKIKIF